MVNLKLPLFSYCYSFIRLMLCINMIFDAAEILCFADLVYLDDKLLLLGVFYVVQIVSELSLDVTLAHTLFR